MKVLIAEDEQLHAEMLSSMVASWGHAVTTVESGWQALEAAACRKIDLSIRVTNNACFNHNSLRRKES